MAFLMKQSWTRLRCSTLPPFVPLKIRRTISTPLFSGTHNADASVATANERSSFVELRRPRWPRAVRLPYLWLRDHCRCAECYDPKTLQRNYDLFDLPLNIRPMALSAHDDALEITWPDKHVSRYDYKFLWQSSPEGSKTGTTVPKHLWKKQTFPALKELDVSKERLYAGDEGCRLLIEKILKYGVGTVSQAEPNIDSTRDIVEKVCAIMHTFYGELWAFEGTSAYADSLDYADSAYTTKFLGAHNDMTYLSTSSRIQIFHCLQPAPEGGDTIVVDGFSIAQQLKECSEESYKFLSKWAIPSEYRDHKRHIVTLDTVLKHSVVTGQLIQFRYNLYDRAPLWSLPFDKIEEFYSHLKALTAIIRKPTNQVQWKLQPGTVLFVDNWRVMHGREKYSGPRIMGGCYLDQNEFTSKARMLGFHVD